MSTTAQESSSSVLDWLKWIVVFALVGGGVFGNWYYQDESLLIRVVALIVIGALALYVATLTERGGAAWALLRDARSEVRRVVWPSNQETTQTTIIVLVLILIFALILWVLDIMLQGLVSAVIG